MPRHGSDLGEGVKLMAKPSGNGQANEMGQVRISFTVDKETRRKVRIAAAHADMEVGEFVVDVLERAAEKAVPSK